MAKTRPETELYPPVKAYLEALGYRVQGEAAGCDVAALNGETLIAVELKNSINLRLLQQAVERQESCDAVYLAVPVDGSGYPAAFKANLKLIKRLELGLLLIRFLKHRTRIELVTHPQKWEQRRNKRRRKAILRELNGRSGDHTPGGTQGKRITAYREEALYLALLLQRHGELSPAGCRELGGSAKAGRILKDNHYGWFEWIARGRYRLHPAGRSALDEYAEIVELIERGGKT